MGVDALVSTVWALPKPSIETLFYSLNEIRTSDISSPIRLPISVSWVRVYVDLSGLALDSQIVRVLALLSLITYSCFEFRAEYRLGVFSFFKLLLLYR